MANPNNMSEIDAHAQMASKNLNKFDEGTQFAVMKVLPNVLNGAFWGFCPENEMQRHLKSLSANSSIKVNAIQKGYLVEIEPAYCIRVLQAVDPATVTQKDIDVMRNAVAEAQISFEKFLINKGKKPDPNTNQPYCDHIGVYCVNDVTTICHKGTNYAAFRLDANNFCALLSKYKYLINNNGKWSDPYQLLQSGEIYKLMVISPTKTGAFIQIRTTVPYDQMKIAEKNFKATYGAK